MKTRDILRFLDKSVVVYMKSGYVFEGDIVKIISDSYDGIVLLFQNGEKYKWVSFTCRDIVAIRSDFEKGELK